MSENTQTRYQAIGKYGVVLSLDDLTGLEQQVEDYCAAKKLSLTHWHILDTQTGEKFALRGRMWIKIK